MRKLFQWLRSDVVTVLKLCHKPPSRPRPCVPIRGASGTDCDRSRFENIESGSAIPGLPQLRLASLLIAIAALVSACDSSSNPRERAADYLAAGRLDAARIEATNAIQTDERDPEAHLILAQVLMAQGDLVTADRALTKAANLGIDRPRVDRLRIRLLLKVRSHTRLLEEIVPTPAHQGEVLAEVLAARGQAQLATGRHEAARASFADALKVVPALPEALIGQAQFAYLDSKPAEAMNLVEQVIARSPGHAGAWQLKAVILHLQGKLDEAVKAYERAAAADPADTVPNLAAAELLIQAGRPDAAQKHVDQARRRSPSAILVHHTQALIHLERKEYDQALAVTHEILRVQPMFTAAILLASMAHLARGDLNQAERRLRPLVQSERDGHMARRLLAMTLLRMGNAKGALDVLQPALTSNTDDPSFFMLVAEEYVRMRDFTTATVYDEKVASLRPDRPEVLARLGMARYAAGDAAQGLATLEKAAALREDSIHADVTLVMLLLDRREFKQALSSAHRIQSKAPNNPIGFNLAGIALIGLNNPSDARSSFERAAALDPSYWPAASNLVRLDLADGRLDAAKARIDRALAADKNSVEAMTALMQITGDRGRFVESLEVARRADPKALAHRFMLSRTYLELGLGDRALSVAHEVAAITPGQPDALDLLGSAQLAAGQASEALATFRDLSSRSPKSSVTHVRLAQAASALGDSRGAEGSYRKALDLQPNNPAAIAGLAGLYGRANRMAEAMKLAEDLKRSNPRSAQGNMLMGDLLFGAKRFREANKAFEAAFAIEPTGGLIVKRHMAATAAGDKPGVEILKQWLAKFPTDLAARAYLADQHYIAGEYRQAIELYQAIVKVDPYRASVHNNLASAYLMLRDPRALPVAQAAYNLKPDDARILDTLGVAQMRHGDPATAVELLRKAIARLPESSAESRVHYALALAKAGDKAAARAELARLFESGKAVSLEPEDKALLESR